LARFFINRAAGVTMDRWWLLILTCIMATFQTAAFAGPNIKSISTHALRRGGTTTIVIDGSELQPEPTLLASFPIKSQEVRAGATPRRVEIDITLDDSAPIGIYQLRLANRRGVSAPLAMAVDALPQAPWSERIEKLPVALHGIVSGSQIARTQFTGKSGQRVVIEVEARRLGSSLNPLIHLYDSRHVQLAWAQGTPSLVDDCRLDVEIPADGKYTIELHDALFRGAASGFFRLKVGEVRYADLVYPLAVERGQSVPLQMAATNLPTSTIDSGKHDTSGFVPSPLPDELNFSGGRPRLLVSDHPEIVEPADGSQPQDVAVPVGLNGRLLKSDEEDRWLLKVTPGTALRLDVLSSRAGAPLDGVLSIRNPKGAQLAASDDRATTSDPGLDFTVPAGVEQLVVALKDLQGRGGERFVYRIGVTLAKQADFSLSLAEDRIEVPQQGTAIVRIKATRKGYNGPIELKLDEAPAGLLMSDAEIPAGASEALLSFSASAVKPTSLLTRLVGIAPAATPALQKTVELPETPVNKYQPWLKGELAVAVTQPAPFELAWVDSSSEPSLTLGAEMPVRLQVTRGPKAKGAVRISLITTQTPPTKKVQKRDVEDTDRTLRLEAALTIPADKSQADTKIIVPGDLATMPYDLALQGELLSPDGKQVLGTAVTPVRRLTPAKPSFELAVAGQPEIEAIAGAGETGRLKGKLVRKAGFARPVVLTLSGLPEGVTAPKVVLQGDQTDFDFPVAFPFGTTAAELHGVKLVASSQLDLKTALNSENEVPVKLKIVPGERPLGQQPHALFEDQSEFSTQLTEGKSRAATVTNEKYSGNLSLQLTPEQKFNPKMPNFGMKIRENPGAGEFRYLQFAWKKVGGQAICLQLAHDGKFGPSDGKPGKFRYHAGPSQECYGASLAVDIKLPSEWTVVTRDLFADFGEFTLTGIGLSPIDGQFGYFDHIYLGKSPADFALVAPGASGAE
jgi:hypothetical protein